MKRKISVVLCISLILCMLPATSVFAAKTIKAKSVSLAPKAMTLAVGDIAQLNAVKNPSNSTDKLTWTSSNKAVATVSSKGVVQGVSEGTATIKVMTTSKKIAQCKVTVKKYVTDAELRKTIKEELSAEFMKKDDLQAYLEQNIYTKDEVDAKIASATSGSSGDSGSSTDWEDGDEASLFPGQVLPVETKDGITIETFSFKRYHNAQFGEDDFSPYKNTYKITGTFACPEEQLKRAIFFGYLYYDDIYMGSMDMSVSGGTIEISGNTFVYEGYDLSAATGNRVIITDHIDYNEVMDD